MKNSFDLTKHVKKLENYKCALLKNVSTLFDMMNDESYNNNDRLSASADILINIYLLSKCLGISFEECDQKAVSKLKLMLLENDYTSDETKDLLVSLSKHFND